MPEEVPDAPSSAPGCGDGVLRAPELCDDGNKIDGDGCDSNCTPTGCGNGILTTGEQCDDGNTTPGDGCSATCNLERCGNGIVDPGENCDDGNLTCGTCSADCRSFALSRATGTIRAIPGNNIVPGDTFTLNDGVNVPRTFEFTSNGNVSANNIPVDIGLLGSSATYIRDRVINAINFSGLLIGAEPTSLNILTLTHGWYTSIGNIPIAETVGDPGFIVSGMSGGAGANCAAGQSCRSNDDCISNFCSLNVCQ
jgi:cysteine-rich repeat protein